jgi:hypothetical protein
MTRRLQRKPPLELDLELENAEGDVTRFPSDSKKARFRPTGLNCGSQRGEGFSTGGAVLQREILRDYPDLNLLDTGRMVGREGSVAYEGRLQAFPRNNSPQTISLNFVGFATYLKSRPVPMLIADRRLGGWDGPSTQRKADVLSGGFFAYTGSMSSGWQFKDGATGPAIVLAFTDFAAGHYELEEAWLYAGGEDIAQLRYDFARLEGSAVNAEFHNVGYLAADDRTSAGTYEGGPDSHAANAAGVVVSASAPGRKFAILQSDYTGSFVGTDSDSFAFLYPRIVGAHGLTPIGASPEEGYGWSDIVDFMLRTYFPKIEYAPESPRSSFPVQQFTGHDREIDGFQVLQELNNLILWETNIWEGPKLHTEPADLTKFDWWIDTTDPGVKVNFQGDSIENFANGIVVHYEDFFGRKYVLTPESHPELLDPNENNPATRHGETLWPPKSVPWPCTEEEALQFGRAQLAEYNRPKRPGSFTIEGGYIRDGAGHWQQGWKVRNSQTLGIRNHPFETEPRLITAPRWDQESLTLTIAVDAPPQTLEAIVARRAMGAEARNL